MIFLDNFTGQTVDELIELEDTHRVDSLVLALESAIWAKRDSGKSLSEAEVVVLAIESMEREVNNGGFSQFFYNPSVEFVPKIVDALQKISCLRTAELASQAIYCLGLENLAPSLIEEIDFDDEELSLKLNKIDNQYYECEENIAGQLFVYVKQNKSKIDIRR